MTVLIVGTTTGSCRSMRTTRTHILNLCHSTGIEKCVCYGGGGGVDSGCGEVFDSIHC
jgi:hypothetical protein